MKKLFPFFKNHPNLHYFDSAATTLKPQSVIDALLYSYTKYTLPIEKSFYKEADEYYEELIIPLKLSLQKLFIADFYEIFFGHSVTSLLNQIITLCMDGFLKTKLVINILLPETVHNSFFIPCKKYKNIIFYYYNTYNYKLLLAENLFDIIYIATIDHITGQLYNYLDFKKYRNNNTIFIGDASQSGMYQADNLSISLFDFFLLSSHKMYGPEGLAVLMVLKEFIYKYKNSIENFNLYFLKNYFAQGSLPYTAFYSFLVALEFLEKNIYNNCDYKKTQIGFINRIYEKISSNKNIVSISSDNSKTIVTFYHNNKHAHDIAIEFSKYNISVRSGDLCSPFNFDFNNNALTRISIGCYINENDINSIIKIISLI
jgi:cysteine desulfurase/selenocysteine lyase